MKSIIATIFIVAILNGCASTYFKARYEKHGEYSEDLIKNSPSNEKPRLFIESAPQGVSIENDRVVVDTSQYEILGRIDVIRNFDSFNLGFIEYNEDWRRNYCPPVVTLTYATLFILVFLTPAPWPCIYETSKSIKRIEERKRNMIAVMLQKASEIGATHVVYARYTHKKTIEDSAVIVPVGNMAMAYGSAEEKVLPYTGITGIALMKKY